MNADPARAARPIICGIDFSENALDAANVAAAIAAKLGAKMLMVHVAERCSSRFETAARREEYVATIHQRLEAERGKLAATDAGIELLVLTEGWAEDALVKLARERDALLVVLSSVSKTAFDRWTIGSVSERVAEKSASPTLIVRDSASLVSWAKGERRLRILAATDFSATSDAVLDWLKTLQQIGPCDVIACHIYWPPDESERYGFGRSLSLGDVPPDLQEAVKRRVTDRVRERLGDMPVEIVVSANWGRPDSPLVDVASSMKAELLVVGTHQRHGLRRVWQTSVSRGVVHHARMNVAVVRLTPEQRHGSGTIPALERVLVATDFSEAADLAIPHAYSALPQGGVVRLVHVVRGKDDESVSDPAGRLRALIPPDAAGRGIETEVEVLHDRDPAREICEEAERFDADVVCIGARGRSGFLGKRLGSIANGVIERCVRPVLLARARQE